MEISKYVKKCPNEDAFLSLADILLKFNLFGKYYEYLTILGDIANIIFDAHQKIQQMAFNDLNDEIEIKIRLTKNLIHEELDRFFCSIYEKEVVMKYAMITLELASYDKRYFLENAKKHWLWKKIQIEKLSVLNSNYIVEKSCNDKISCYEIIENNFKFIKNKCSGFFNNLIDVKEYVFPNNCRNYPTQH